MDYEPFGNAIAETGSERADWVGKEEDFENNLRDHGVRKYDEMVERFNSIDPLWEKQFPYSPYHYSYNSPLVFHDKNGRLPGDLFVSPAQAAHDFGKNYNPLSIDMNREFGATIYIVEQDGKKSYTYSIPEIGSFKGTNVSVNPDGTTAVADVHSHAAYDKDYESNVFSDDDIADSKKKNLTSYLVTTNGTLMIYDPESNKTKVVTKDMPRDANDPTTKENKTPEVINNETRATKYYKGYKLNEINK